MVPGLSAWKAATLAALARADYEALLQAAGTDSWKAGYLQYSIVDQYQQLTLDFACLNCHGTRDLAWTLATAKGIHARGK